MGSWLPGPVDAELQQIAISIHKGCNPAVAAATNMASVKDRPACIPGEGIVEKAALQSHTIMLPWLHLPRAVFDGSHCLLLWYFIQVLDRHQHPESVAMP